LKERLQVYKILGHQQYSSDICHKRLLGHQEHSEMPLNEVCHRLLQGRLDDQLMRRANYVRMNR
jgi:hypothetical protein